MQEKTLDKQLIGLVAKIKNTAERNRIKQFLIFNNLTFENIIEIIKNDSYQIYIDRFLEKQAVKPQTKKRYKNYIIHFFRDINKKFNVENGNLESSGLNSTMLYQKILNNLNSFFNRLIEKLESYFDKLFEQFSTIENEIKRTNEIVINQESKDIFKTEVFIEDEYIRYSLFNNINNKIMSPFILTTRTLINYPHSAEHILIEKINKYGMLLSWDATMDNDKHFKGIHKIFVTNNDIISIY